MFNSALGATVFPQALAGEPVLGFGDIDLPHSYGYIRDVALGPATLGEHESAGGRVWHLPVVPAVSTREIHALIAAEIGRPVTVDLITAPKPSGPFDEAFMREYEELFYQYTEPQIVVSNAIEETFGLAPTPLPEAIAATVAWYRGLGG